MSDRVTKCGLVLLARCVNKGINLSAEGRNVRPSVAVRPLNPGLSVSAKLVCRTNKNEWEEFCVVEGPFMVDDGVFKVYK
jgi:hypothetical protein